MNSPAVPPVAVVIQWSSRQSTQLCPHVNIHMYISNVRTAATTQARVNHCNIAYNSL